MDATLAECGVYPNMEGAGVPPAHGVDQSTAPDATAEPAETASPAPATRADVAECPPLEIGGHVSADCRDQLHALTRAAALIGATRVDDLSYASHL